MFKIAKTFIIVLISIAVLTLALSITAHSLKSAGTLVLLGLFYIFAPGWIFVNMFLREALLIEKITTSAAAGMIFLTLASAYASLFGFKLSSMVTAAFIIVIIISIYYKAFQKNKKDTRKHGH